MTKLAILGTRGIPARYGGFETFAEQIATRLVRRGVDVTVFCPSPGPKPSELFNGVTLNFVKYPSLGKFSEMFWDARCLWGARKGFDVVYMLGVGSAFAVWVPRIFGARVWVNTDGIEWKRSKFTWWQRAYLEFAESLSILFASRIIADADAIAAYLRKRYPMLKNISTIAYGAEIPAKIPDENAAQALGLRAHDYYIVVCRLEPENHVLEIIEGFERANTSLPLVILGNIENPNPYVQRLLGHKSNKIRFVGAVYDREKLGSLRFNARAYIHGHSVGGTNPSLLEAMASSSLVIAHDNPFNREVLGDFGMFFRTSDDLSSNIRAIEEGRVRKDILLRGAIDRIRTNYHWDQIVERYTELLHTD